MRRPNFEVDETTFPAEAYTVKGKNNKGIAWRVYGWELEAVLEADFYDNETDTLIVGMEWNEERTGRVVCVMIGDDRRFTFDPDELTPLADLDYCAVCGQVGCTHDGRERE